MVIVGGGTAGWLSAVHLSRFWRAGEPSRKPLEITLIESPEVAPIGVGESTTGLFTHFIRSFTTEREFLRETNATFKLGILHRDWHRDGGFYLGPLNSLDYLGIERRQPESFPYYLAAAVARGEPAWKDVLNSPLMLAKQAPYSRPPGKDEQTAWDYAYHFDAKHVGAFIRKRLDDVAVIEANISHATQEPGSGYIASVTLEDGREIEGDLFIDCSGFRRLLIGGVYDEEWISYGDALPVNRALPFSLSHEEGAQIPSYTHAWALSSGWLWQIPTQERFGCGYVYCDAFITPEEARAEVEQVLGRQIEPWGDLRFDSGRHRRLWVKNCVAVGLSAAFSEPLESTSIHGQLVQLRTLVTEYLTEDFDFDETPVIDSYNRRMGRMYDDFRDFLVMHYQGGRADTPFWRSIGANDSARELLELWRLRTPRASDFADYFGSLSVELWFYTLDGLGLLSRDAAQRELDQYGLWTEADRAHAQQRRAIAEFEQHAVDQAEYLRELQRGVPPSRAKTLPARPQPRRSRAQRRRRSRR